MVSMEYIPKVFNVGKILPTCIHKGHGKSKDNPSNYREIKLSVLGKLFERLILNRLQEWASKYKKLPTLSNLALGRGPELKEHHLRCLKA